MTPPSIPPAEITTEKEMLEPQGYAQRLFRVKPLLTGQFLQLEGGHSGSSSLCITKFFMFRGSLFPASFNPPTTGVLAPGTKHLPAATLLTPPPWLLVPPAKLALPDAPNATPLTFRDGCGQCGLAVVHMADGTHIHMGLVAHIGLLGLHGQATAQEGLCRGLQRL